MSAQGYYCSTSDKVFTDRSEMQQHYQSELHKYNLKRKLAGLPPVTREWFEARKAQLLNQQPEQVERVWFCPLSRKKFTTEGTYLTWTRSKKYTELVKASGQPAPQPVISVVTKQAPAQGQAPQAQAQAQERQAAQRSAADEPASTSTAAPPSRKPKAPAGFVAKPPVRSYVNEMAAKGIDVTKRRDEAQESASDVETSEDEDDEEGEWETASEEDIQEYYMEKSGKAATSTAVEGEEEEEEAENPYGSPDQWAKWDVCRCLFCNQVAPDVERSVEHMWKTHGFMIPDSEYVSDLEGLIGYLGLKISAGHVPLHVRGDDPNGKRFRSLHACQRHMVDTNQCKMVFEGNEEEYEDFYDYSALEERLKEQGQLMLAGDAGPDLGTGGYELILPTGNGRTVTLGHRDFARYYKQNLRATDSRKSVLVNRVNAQYRLMGLANDRRPDLDKAQRMMQRKEQRHRMRLQIKMDWMSAKILDLDQFVPW